MGTTTRKDSMHRGRRRESERSDEQDVVSISEDFGLYQIVLLVLTQFSYIPVAASMLSASFLIPSQKACSSWTGNGSFPMGEFHSLLVDWSIACTEEAKGVQTMISEVIMAGALGGAFLSGFLADRFGRKPIIIGTLSILSLGNGLLLLSGVYSEWWMSIPVYTAMGAACGGYMTTNLVLVVESLCSPSSRLLVVALNGWSLSMTGTAALAALLPHWLHFHAAIATLATLSVAALFFVADESLRWLRASRKMTRYDVASERLAKFNGQLHSSDVALVNLLDIDEEKRKTEEGQKMAQVGVRIGDTSRLSRVEQTRAFSYLDLFRDKRLRPHLLSVAYCFLVSSIVSFGFYFAVDTLSGNRYANLAIMGIGKFVLGLLPFIVSRCCSRKQVALVSVTAASLSAWTIVLYLYIGYPLTSILPSIFSVLAAATLDPTWKISHLYSTELFPTNMRNMARGFCNAAGRTGSVLAPLVNHFRHDWPLLPYSLFAVLLTGQLLVTLFFLPAEISTNLDDPLPLHIADADGDGESRSQSASTQSDESAPLSP